MPAPIATPGIISDAKIFISHVANLAKDKKWDDLHHAIENCSSEVAYYLTTSGPRAIFMSKVSDKISLEKLYLKAMSVPGFTYEDVMQRILNPHENVKTIMPQLLYDLLKDEHFRKNFIDDKKLAPFLGSTFYDNFTKLIQANSTSDNLMLTTQISQACNTVRQYQVTDAMIDEELKRVYQFQDPLSAEQSDLIMIAKFLANQNAVFTQFAKLELELEKLAGERYDADKIQLKGYVEGEPYKHDKLLSGYLYQWAKENGFPSYAKLKGIILDNTFFEILGKGALFKDSTFQGDPHGGFSHFITWVLIGMWNKENPLQTKLKCDLDHLLKWIGENKKNLWEDTFEKPGISYYKPANYNPSLIDFRNVTDLNEFLLRPDCKFPILHQLIAGRHAKGQWKKSIDDHYEITEFPKHKK